MGTPDFSVPSLTALYDAGYEITSVFTQPDKQRGRGKKVTFSAVKEKALELGLSVEQPETLRDEAVVAALRAQRPDVIIVIAYGKILPKDVLDIPTYGCLNVHGSLLPAYRGAAPIQYAIKDGVAESGVTVMVLDEGMDTGAIVKEAALRLAPKETTGTLFTKLAALGAKTLLPVVAALPDSLQAARPQDDTKATYTAKIGKDEACLHWTEDAVTLERLIRTLDPQPGAYTTFAGKRLKIWAADVVSGTTDEPGTVIAVTKKSFTVQTGKDALVIREVQPESRKRMTTAQFLQGVDLVVGDFVGALEEN